ncbi:efflux RND transporter permease subunit [Desulfobacter sp. UBA2225]|uniref:efflux RND transporter permease subunit n=1 Tax=Desulfobacter sp. UBA2225 TaxID=1961413 RepID=UPI002580D2F8|nr:efflux RND transporter permease subunit [Desulfobacter sp. UBA2225]
MATRYREGADYYDIRVMVSSESLKSKFELENLIIKSNSDQPVYVKDIARVERSTGPVEIIREDRAKQIIVRADSQGISVGEAVARAELAVGQIQKTAGVSFEMGGQAKMMADNRKAMGIIFGFAVLFAYVILAIQFESFLLPILMMINIPLSLTGAFLALYLTATPIGVTVLIGLIVMMGGITSQGVVLLSLAESFRFQVDTAAAAVGLAAPLRIQPILMTQLTTILGLVPLALNLGSGGDMLQPMAIAVIGGLTYSLLLTLLFLPVAYSIAMDRKERWKTEDKLITKTARMSVRLTQLN